VVCQRWLIFAVYVAVHGDSYTSQPEREGANSCTTRGPIAPSPLEAGNETVVSGNVDESKGNAVAPPCSEGKILFSVVVVGGQGLFYKS
jgi:hypothetical protein